MLVALLSMLGAQASFPPPVTSSPVSPPPLMQLAPPPAPPAPRAGSVSEPRMLNQMEVFAEANYPFFAKAQADEGFVRFRVTIDPRGVASDCVITEPAKAPTLNQPTCDLVLAKGRFVPARDRRGRAVTASFSRRVAWVLMNRERLQIADSHERVVLTFDGAGKVACRTERSDGVEMDPRTCPTILATPMVRSQSLPPNPAVKAMMARFDMVSENSSFIGPDAAARAARVGKGKDEMLNLRTITRVTIDAGGKVSGCAIVDRQLPPFADAKAAPPADPTCEKMALVTFAPDKASERVLVMVNAAYFRPR